MSPVTCSRTILWEVKVLMLWPCMLPLHTAPFLLEPYQCLLTVNVHFPNAEYNPDCQCGWVGSLPVTLYKSYSSTLLAGFCTS